MIPSGQISVRSLILWLQFFPSIHITDGLKASPLESGTSKTERRQLLNGVAVLHFS